MSDEKMTLKQKLIEIQKNLTYFKKNTSGNNYQYTSGASILGEIKQWKDKFGVMLRPEIETATVEKFRTDKDKDMFFYIANGYMIWSDEIEEIKIKWYFTGKQNDPSKAFGSALTYSERYFLLKFFGIPTDELDADVFKKMIIPEDIKINQTEVIEALREMYRLKIDGFNVITRVQNSMQKHLGVKIKTMKDIANVVKGITDKEKLDKYSTMLINKITEGE